jgi:hypothetical protein
MVGNKTDMRHLRAVTVEEGKRFAEEKGIFFIESSAVESVNVDRAFVRLIEEITNTVIPKIINEAANSPDAGVWPYMPSTQIREKAIPGQDKGSNERTKNRGNTCFN